MTLMVAVAATLLTLMVAAQLPSAGQLAPRTVTSSRSVIDPHADSTGPIVIGPNGTGYVAWEHPMAGAGADTVLFCAIPAGGTCKKPVKLPIPDGDGFIQAVTQPFPVLGGAPGVVYVVGPRYVPGDTVIWTSHNGGDSFSKGIVVPADSYAGDTNVDDVLRVPDPKPKVDFFVVASVNVGLGFSLTGPTIVKCNVCSFSFGAADVEGATLGLSGDGAVEAYWNLPTKGDPTVDYYWSKYDDVALAGVWKGPIRASVGVNARLAGGPKGLFLLSQDFVGKESQPTRLDVRKWDPATHTFGPPMKVVNDSPSSGSIEIGGFGEDTLTGALYVAWAGQSSKGAYMRLWVSTDDGTKWSAAADVARFHVGYGGPARLAVRDGKGFLTYDDGGLVLIDLAHL